MKIAFFELERLQQDFAKDRLAGHDLVFFGKTLDKVDMQDYQDAEVLAAFIYSKITREVMQQMPNLKMIATMSTGFDHIDLDYCKERGITVSNVPVYGDNTVAEHTFALILSLSRNLYRSIDRVKRKHSFKADRKIRGFDLKGKTLGLIGCGNIGKHVARIAKGFAMEVLVYDLNKDEDLAREYGFSYVDFDDLLAQSDILSIHVPHNRHTHHLIDDSAISKMKEGSFIINTARGKVIDTDALTRALKSRRIAGAGLDVLEEEREVHDEIEVLLSEPSDRLKTVLQEHILMQMDNVIITPHNAFNSKEAVDRILITTIENIIGFEKGRPQNKII